MLAIIPNQRLLSMSHFWFMFAIDAAVVLLTIGVLIRDHRMR